MQLDLNMVLLGIGMLGMIVFMFKRELFISPKSFKILLVVSILLFISAYVLPLFDAFKNRPVNVLKHPIFALLLYRALRAFFREMNDREPKNTFWMMHWEKGIWADTMFNVSYWIICVILFIFII